MRGREWYTNDTRKGLGGRPIPPSLPPSLPTPSMFSMIFKLNGETNVLKGVSPPTNLQQLFVSTSYSN